MVTQAEFINLLLEAGKSADPNKALLLPGAGNFSDVSHFSGNLHLRLLASWPLSDRIAFTKALACYEGSIGDLGSVSALWRVLPLFQDSPAVGYEVYNWILKNTDSLRQYRNHAVDFVEPDLAAIQRRLAIEANERKNYELAAPARERKRKKATANLFNAIRRCDLKAVDALLAKGADPKCSTPDGKTLIDYAKEIGHLGIIESLQSSLQKK